MTIENSIYAYLTSPTSNTGVIIGDRLYPLALPQDPRYEAATFQRITSQLTATGQSAPGDLEAALFQFDCFHPDFDQAHALARAIRADLSGYRGAMSGTQVDAVHFRNEFDDWGDEAGVCRVTLEFLFLYK